MLQWTVIGAWVFAVALAIVVLGFAAYELRWKVRRLATDRRKLEGVIAQLTATAAQLQVAAERAAAARRASSEG